MQLPDVCASSGPPDQTCVVHHRTDELLVEQNTVPDRQNTSSVNEGPSTPNLWAAFFPTWLMCAGQLSCVSRVTPRCRAVSIHCISCPRNSTGLGFRKRLAALTKRTAVLFDTMVAIPQSSSQCSGLRRGPADNRREAMDCGTWLRQPCRPRTASVDVAGGCRYVIHIQTEQHRGDETILGHCSPQPRRVDACDWNDVWNVRQSRYEDTFFTRKDGKLQESAFI
jgi:hypothetical protein